MRRLTARSFGLMLAIATLSAFPTVLPADAGPEPGVRQAPPLGLSRSTWKLVSGYPLQVRALQKHPGDETLYQVLDTAEALRTGLTGELGSRLAAARPPQRAAMAKQLATMCLNLPGVVPVGAVGGTPFGMAVNYRGIGVLLPNTAPARALLIVAGDLLGTNGWPPFIRRQPGGSGCLDLAAIREPLEDLPEAWRQAPVGLQQRLRGPLLAGFDQLVSLKASCNGPSKARAEAHQLAGLLRGLPELNGPAYAERLLALVGGH